MVSLIRTNFPGACFETSWLCAPSRAFESFPPRNTAALAYAAGFDFTGGHLLPLMPLPPRMPGNTFGRRRDGFEMAEEAPSRVHWFENLALGRALTKAFAAALTMLVCLTSLCFPCRCNAVPELPAGFVRAEDAPSTLVVLALRSERALGLTLSS